MAPYLIATFYERSRPVKRTVVHELVYAYVVIIIAIYCSLTRVFEVQLFL